MLPGKSRAIIFNLNAACGFYYLFHSLKVPYWKIGLKVERSSLQFMNLNLLRTQLNENLTFWGSPCGRTKDLVRKQLLWNIIYNFDFKIQSVDRIFFPSRKNISCSPWRPKISRSQSHMREFQIYPSNLRRDKKDTVNWTVQNSPSLTGSWIPRNSTHFYPWKCH